MDTDKDALGEPAAPGPSVPAVQRRARQQHIMKAPFRPAKTLSVHSLVERRASATAAHVTEYLVQWSNRKLPRQWLSEELLSLDLQQFARSKDWSYADANPPS